MFSHVTVHLRLILTPVAAVLMVGALGAATVNAGSVQNPSTSGDSPAAKGTCKPLTEFERDSFPDPLRIDNPNYPLTPGTQFTLDGTINVGTVPTQHRVIFTVTDLTKVIAGVRTRVLWDQDVNAGELAESELAFQAQDEEGNVWVLGEYPEIYEGGTFMGAPDTWIARVKGGKGGVLVPGQPRVGTRAFLEGRSPKIDFFDCGQVTAVDQTLPSANTAYNNVLVINEWDPGDPEGGTQQKYYAPGVGNVQIGALNDPQAETLTLTSVVALSADALAQVREEALRLDRHGYKISEAYRQTPRAQ